MYMYMFSVHVYTYILYSHIFQNTIYSRRGTKEGAKGEAASPPPLFFAFLLIIIHIIHCYTHYFNLQAGVKIVIITIVKIIIFITNT